MKWLLLVFALSLEAEEIQPDTAELTAKLKSVHLYKQLPAKDFNEIQAQSITWIDKRIRARLTSAQINAELSAAGVFEPEKLESHDDNIMVNFTGFLNNVAINPIPGATDLFAVKIEVGLMCGFDETVLVYKRDPIRRISRLDHHDAKFQSARAFSSMIASTGVIDGATLFASATYSVWCTSTYIGIELRVDKIENGSMHNLLRQAEGARFWADPEKLVNISIDGSVVTFRYTATLSDADLMARPAIARYSITRNAAARIPPVALSRIGFIDEWLKMNHREAGKWSERQAADRRGAVNAWFKNEAMQIESISRCPGTVPIWEIAISRIELNKSATRKWFFVMSESGASQMRMIEIGANPRPGCNAVKQNGFEVLAEELSR